YNITGNIHWGLPLRPLNGTVNFSSNIGYSKTKQFINTVPNTIRTFTAGPAVRFDLSPSDKLDLSLGAGMNYNSSTYSLQAAYNTRYFSQQYDADINWQLPARFYLSTSFSYTINSQRAAGFDTAIPLWTASFSRQFLRF